jgi:hypothetical protein
VADIMTEELGWSPDVKAEQIRLAKKYVESYAGRIPDKRGSTLRQATYNDLVELFSAIDTDGSGFLDRQEVGELASVLGFPLTEKELDVAFNQMDQNRNGRVVFEEFELWWNQSRDTQFHKNLCQELSLHAIHNEDLKKIGTGTFLG